MGESARRGGRAVPKTSPENLVSGALQAQPNAALTRELHARSTFSHPDFTVGLGISPSLRRKEALAGFHRRSGIAAAPLTLPRRLLSVVARIIRRREGNVKF